MRDNIQEAKAERRAAEDAVDRLIARDWKGEMVPQHEINAALDRLSRASHRLIDAITSDGFIGQKLN